MNDATNQFYNSIENIEKVSQRDLVSFFVYFLTVKLAQKMATSKNIKKCFSDCDLEPPARTATYLWEGNNSKPKKFLKVDDGGYKLERNYLKKIENRLGIQKIVQQTSNALRNLEDKVTKDPAKNFLKETLDCFKVRAHRATVIMIWILAVDHLYSHIWANKERLAEFNKVLATNVDKSIKIKKISKRDDFCEIPDGKFIEFCKKANIISRDVKKILDMSIITRNSSAHPSGIEIKESKVISVVEDLITNVILKYPI